MSKKILGAALGAAALLCGGMVATMPIASADPLPHAGAWWLAYHPSGDDAEEDDAITEMAVFNFRTEINYVPTNIECRVPQNRFIYTLQSSDLGPHAASGVVDLDLVPPAVISESGDPTGTAVCQDVSQAPYGSGQSLDATTDGMTPWSVHIEVPPVPLWSHLFGGTVEGGLSIPEDGIEFADPSIGCTAQVPHTLGGVTIEGEYEIGELTLDTPQGLDAWSPDNSCLVENTELITPSVITLYPALTFSWKP